MGRRGSSWHRVAIAGSLCHQERALLECRGMLLWTPGLKTSRVLPLKMRMPVPYRMLCLGLGQKPWMVRWLVILKPGAQAVLLHKFMKAMSSRLALLEGREVVWCADALIPRYSAVSSS